MDDWGRTKLAFDLEVCALPKSCHVGVYRKRVKGDIWYYKRLCEDILRCSGFIWNGQADNFILNNQNMHLLKVD